jgi:hypothetical protein
MVKTMKLGATARQIDLAGKPAMVTELERAGAERRSLYHSQRWLRVRRQFLMAHPLCCECEHEGLVVPASVVDHRLGHQHRNWRESFWDQDGWQSLCLDCHAKKSAGELAEWNRVGGSHRRSDDVPREGVTGCTISSNQRLRSAPPPSRESGAGISETRLRPVP